MSHVDIILPSKEEEENPRLYVTNKLVPMVSRLYAMCNELIIPGAGEQEHMDMTTAGNTRHWKPISVRVNTNELKTFAFELDPKLPPVKDGKRLFALITATLYVTQAGTAAFRIVRTRDSMPIEKSEMRCINEEPAEFSMVTRISNTTGYIATHRESYHIQGRMLHGLGQPICRRFAIHTIYQ